MATLTTTFKLLRKVGACTERYKFLRSALKGVEDEEPPPPQAIIEPSNEIAAAVSSTASTRFRRSPNGAPSSTAQNINAPPLLPLFHGSRGEWLAALVVVVIVSLELPVALELKLT